MSLAAIRQNSDGNLCGDERPVPSACLLTEGPLSFAETQASHLVPRYRAYVLDHTGSPHCPVHLHNHSDAECIGLPE
jgi:hypothetical protein